MRLLARSGAAGANRFRHVLCTFNTVLDTGYNFSGAGPLTVYWNQGQVIAASYTTASGGHQPANEARSYDLNGNRNGSGFTVGADNHLTSDGTFTFTFDPAGNLSTRIRVSSATAADYKTLYDWDYRNGLTDVENFDNNGVLTLHVHYAYDVFDHLIGAIKPDMSWTCPV